MLVKTAKGRPAVPIGYSALKAKDATIGKETAWAAASV
jgi:hypothetical protein